MTPTTTNFDNEVDVDIPVLTDVIAIDGDQPYEMTLTSTQDQTSSRLSQQESLEQIEKKLNESVLQQLLTRIDFVLEHRVKDSLADVLQTASDDLAKNIRAGLENTLEEIVQRAINQEISKLQSQQSQRDE